MSLMDYIAEQSISESVTKSENLIMNTIKFLLQRAIKSERVMLKILLA